MQIPKRKPGKYTHLELDPHLTEDKFCELEKKLEKLKKISRPRAAAEVGRLAELGDFSENVEYQLAKGRLRGINNNILILENQLIRAVIIKPQKQISTVQLGHKVTVENNKGQKTYQILGSEETRPQQGVISHNSPIGAALIGRREGDIVKIKIADNELKYKIIKIM
ncbi:MAG: hypothetical protein COU29_04290 [Candidatus Magasanikbacteria bacterium CG10_big_fil_rev_8_21_14_0_10_36_32]|uniref:Transcription elongation factor GreA n=1 Tax=Candidatus Magasanikbacteria bacterium CG10_big_fil_rev_8_21_14_0_10_36_32 TaxID=1974646 RepID=A0A2M6W5B6_9BACT|nr:MAG: hypothetical protein COU29_04290 [Candidatus Magasanikbacteria bacterium CG10_big_fil_rev_8_21_14_0_10_36_32]